MYKCSTPHKGKAHRRRNRFLKKTRDPLHWWGHTKKTSKWGTDKAHESPILDPVTCKSAKVRRDGTINSSDNEQVTIDKDLNDKSKNTSRLVEQAPATALSWLKKKVPLFGGGRT